MTQSHDLDNIFTYHASSPEQAEKYTKLRAHAKVVAGQMLEMCPQSRERSLALTKLEESIMWANASIARNKRPQEDGQ